MSSSWAAVLRKDLLVEFRTRYGLSAVVMFLLVTVAIILFSLPGEQINPSTMSALFWIALFFGAMTGLSRSFIAEEERGTSFLLRIYSPSESVFFGKLAFNLLLMLAISITGIILFSFFFSNFIIQDWPVFLLQLILGAAGIGVVSTMLSALIGRAAQKGALLPVIALPVLMPIVIATTDATRITMQTATAWDARGDLLILFSFDVAMVLVSYVLFDTIWKE
jgi:heme exporter protein B